jgi:magnesium transporter
MTVVLNRVRAHRGTHISPQIGVLYVIMDSLVDSFFPVLADLDETIDSLESAILKNPTEEQLGQLFDMKQRVMMIRRVVAPQRDMIESLNGGVVSIPGMTDSDSVYFRSIYDHTIRITDSVDSYRDLISGAMDTHLSMVSNRLNVIMKQLAIVATFFLPLGFLTGFFGQNFGWLQAHLQSSLPWFLFLGIGSELVAIVLLLMMFRRRGWLGSGPTA